MNPRGSATAAALAVALLLSGCGAAEPAANFDAAPSPVVATQAACPQLSPEEIGRGDIAAASGEFVPWVDYQERFGTYVSSIQSAYSGEFAAAFVEANCGRGAIYFKGAVPGTLAGRAPDVEGVTFVPHLGLNEVEAGEMSRKVFDAAQAELDPLSMSGGFNWQDRTIEITYGLNPEDVEPSREQLASLADRLEAAVPLPNGVTVTVRYATGPVDPAP